VKFTNGDRVRILRPVYLTRLQLFFYIKFAEKAPCSRKIPETLKRRRSFYFYLFSAIKIKTHYLLSVYKLLLFVILKTKSTDMKWSLRPELSTLTRIYVTMPYLLRVKTTHVALEITYIYHVYWNSRLTQQTQLPVIRLTSSICVYENSCSAASCNFTAM
jgi:hypothetical protein